MKIWTFDVKTKKGQVIDEVRPVAKADPVPMRDITKELDDLKAELKLKAVID